jgi:hypothetical protein
MKRESEGKNIGIPHLAKNERDMGHPSFVEEPEHIRVSSQVGSHSGLAAVQLE